LLDVMPDTVTTRLVVGQPVDGYEQYDDAVAAYPPEPLGEELEGHGMFYSSGTTGRPKGVKYPLVKKPVGTPEPALGGFGSIYGVDEDAVYLSPAPLYHAAPLQFCIAMVRLGGTSVIMERFDAEDMLAAIERYGITHAQFVPTM